MFLIKLVGEERFELSRPQESSNFESTLSTIPTFARLNKIWYPSKDLNLHFIRFELIASAVGLERYMVGTVGFEPTSFILLTPNQALLPN